MLSYYAERLLLSNYNCHVSPREIASGQSFFNSHELWSAMRRRRRSLQMARYASAGSMKIHHRRRVRTRNSEPSVGLRDDRQSALPKVAARAKRYSAGTGARESTATRWGYATSWKSGYDVRACRESRRRAARTTMTRRSLEYQSYASLTRTGASRRAFCPRSDRLRLQLRRDGYTIISRGSRTCRASG